MLDVDVDVHALCVEASFDQPSPAKPSVSCRVHTRLASYWPCLDTLTELELELVSNSNSNSNTKLTLALEVFG
jgi:hypothetical protein